MSFVAHKSGARRSYTRLSTEDPKSRREQVDSLIYLLLHCSKRLCFFSFLVTITFLALLVSVGYLNSKTRYTLNYVSRKHSLYEKKWTFDPLSRLEKNMSQYSNGINNGTTLWNEVGCLSTKPLLLCKRDERFNSSYVLATKSVFSNTSILKSKAGSCALVGSSALLLSRMYANDIDRHDIVVRMNDAPIHPYEKYVGKRIPDVAIINRAISLNGKCLQNVNYKTLLVQAHFGDGIAAIRRFCATHGPVYAVSPHIIRTGKSIVRQYSKKYEVNSTASLSAGMIGAIFCLHFCSELDVYGFEAKPGKLYAYYRDILTFKSKHSFNLEQQFLKDVSKNLTSPLDISWMGCKKVYFHD